ncbi:hypothetical protein, partial [Cardiobacterium hominis]|uniref:hypothetical protein n=1 Tax=Cardiobacterium hominis TaxID=2718 RepID=UPI0024905983
SMNRVFWFLLIVLMDKLGVKTKKQVSKDAYLFYFMLPAVTTSTQPRSYRRLMIQHQSTSVLEIAKT